MIQAGFLGASELFAAGRLPPEVIWIDPQRPEVLTTRRWDLLTLSRGGCERLEAHKGLFCACETLLVPGDCGGALLQRIRAERVVGYGVDRKDSLTFSSMGDGQKVLCIQRELRSVGGTTVEPQEIPLPDTVLHLPEEGVLALMGTRLLLGALLQ
ncbi:hypothetical protein KQI82_07905 [Oscillibacter sp. MSJ-2]|uniref:Uncharacterized protein n=1 Tax=Dysosmobacter acutus TaxID=2841504 RepID=A0ABS6F967_9FIRM|nr:hypothetical protein [Dysosmobacter acutus]MBU5626837.1 hypothetical protein [Dysosmobacter acutus]